MTSLGLSIGFDRSHITSEAHGEQNECTQGHFALKEEPLCPLRRADAIQSCHLIAPDDKHKQTTSCGFGSMGDIVLDKGHIMLLKAVYRFVGTHIVGRCPRTSLASAVMITIIGCNNLKDVVRSACVHS